MSTWQERFASGIDKQVNYAEKTGAFEDNPLVGKPLPGDGQPYREDWWITQKVAAERVGVHGLPVPLALRREAQDLRKGLVGERPAASEAALRAAITDYDERSDAARRTPQSGPSVVIPRVDADQAVAAWRQAREAK
ncbi:DUF1992 domain-containing protein [Catenulispora sp. NF23]|uniref:DUF1992 domain-containing protein n=1 Tax=Catenulispora pinistramenti TaxID=2705254 RepID=A0ABS5KU92_9ACTN|nr:DUF1992 domain-containing protein [Catenulispora pinistramenti]MBS2538169.1 DUF1992 domain-containing protein [Catenulispora pinistramenti]MBS2549603.1 DUF1992 domain-containing protein [Catenulispora pinistramenti]